MPRPIEELLPEKPVTRLRIYAYAIHDEAHAGMLKVGQTTKRVKDRVDQQLKTAAIENFTIVLDEPADRPDGSVFRDHDVRARLAQKGFANPVGEWMRCTVEDVRTAIAELRTNRVYEAHRYLDFPMRAEQQAAVDKTFGYFRSRWTEDPDAVPEFLWNAKMRFGKTFTTYQLAKRLGAKRVLV
ncbi:MAG: GIY-YIG nuclease family protein, partial [Microbacterium sp.]